jgi:hypothetical protein
MGCAGVSHVDAALGVPSHAAPAPIAPLFGEAREDSALRDCQWTGFEEPQLDRYPPTGEKGGLKRYLLTMLRLTLWGK